MSKKVYFNGEIVTMEKELYAEAVLTENGKIKRVGSREECMEEGAVKIDLQGKTLLPAFIDAHSHLSGYANSLLQVSLEGAADFQEIEQRLQEFVKRNGVEKGKWVRADGFDHHSLSEKTHPTRRELDAALPDHPVMVVYKSGHVGIFNTKALERLGIDKDTKVPEGGKLEFENGELTGYMEENAFIENQLKVPMNSVEELTAAFLKAQEVYASYGITTVQEGLMLEVLGGLYQHLIEHELLKLDVVAYVDSKNPDRLLSIFSDSIKEYRHHFKIGGYKVILDGSPQSRTAWMLEPYQYGEGEYGYPALRDDNLKDMVTRAVTEKMQLLAHCNGDAAAAQFLRIYRQVLEEQKAESEIRPVMIHAQLLKKEQMREVKELGIIPSFFAAHIWYWGDIHVINFGRERANKISAAGSAAKEGIIFTFHQDSPVLEPDMLQTIWCAVNRKTRQGKLLGAEERLSVLEALKAVTIYAAYQYSEEKKKGSIREGKLADFVLLSENPLKAEPERIKEIEVLETIQSDECIYQKKKEF